jgi:hypothetical protein
VTEWTPGELRAAALEALGDHGDERAREALRRAELTLAPGVARWDSSAGPVEAHDVTLVLDAATLGTLRAVPALVDALAASLAATLATRPGQALRDLSLRWSPPAVVASGYRDALPPPYREALREALAAYLEAAGQLSLAELARLLDVDETDPAVVVLGVPASLRREVHPGAPAFDALARAARDLLGDPRLRVRVR